MQNRSFLYHPLDFSPEKSYFFAETEVFHTSDFHFFNALLIGFCRSGSGKLYFPNGQSYGFHAEDTCLIYPFVPNTILSDETSSWTLLFLEPQLFLQNHPFADILPWQIFSLLQRVPVLYPKEDSSSFHELLKAIREEYERKDPLYEKAIHGLILSALYELNRQTIICDPTNTSQHTGAFPYVLKALTYIYENYQKPLTVRELAAICEISESHLRRLFLQMVGTNPLDFLQHYRILQACQLIKNTDLPFHLIAQAVGYTSISSFNRQFRQYLHLSPSDWKKLQ